MAATEWRWKSGDGLDMLAREWVPSGPRRGLVVLVHGFDDHGGRYLHVGEALAAAGFVLCSADTRGQGRSGGPWAWVESYDRLMDDLDAFLALCTARHPGLPRFLYGHSMGGNQVINYLLRRKPSLAGAVATSPWLELAVKAPAWQLAAARLAAALPLALAIPTGMDPGGVSRDPAVVAAYLADPCVRGRITPRLLVSILDAGQWALSHAAELTVPVLLLHGGSDQITSEAASRRFAAAAGERVTYRTWPDAFHELHNEPEKPEVLKAITGWLASKA